MAIWKEYLLRLAEKNKMCVPYLEALDKCETKSDAIKLYKREVDWAIKANYPPLNILRSEFSHCEKDGIFVNRIFAGELFKKQLCYVFHNCIGRITVDIDLCGANIPMLYVANGSDLRIERAVTADITPIQVPVYVFGDSKVVAENNDRVSFVIFRK